MSEITTAIEVQQPRAYLEFRNGRLRLLQFGDVADADHEAFLDSLREALGRGLRQHTTELVAALSTGGSVDPAREAAMRFVAEQLAAAEGATPMPQPRWFAGLADGRDPSGYVHVTVAGDQVVVLEAPVGTLADGRTAGHAITAALNQALDRVAADYAPHVGEQRKPEPLDWDLVVRDINRLRQGY